jgi:hypothetical protein
LARLRISYTFIVQHLPQKKNIMSKHSKHWIGLSVVALLSTATPAIALADEAASSKEAESGPSGMRTAGGVLIGLGGASIFVGGIVTFIDLSRDGQFSGVTALIVGLPLIGGGLLMTGIGIPLYIVGGPKPKSSAFSTPPPPPVTVSAKIGFGSAALKVTF